MAMILPKGIVVNSPEASRSIEELESHALSNADIARFWKVYTTTQRRLKDPTAERLESLWWRIWGSRKRELSGAAVAKLFSQISNGETFVPLRGPPNRDEGPPSTLPERPQLIPSASSTTALGRHDQNGSGNDSPSSRDQVPMPHPILKKTRGPSNSGPKPTARFVLPDEAEDETSPDSFESPNAHVVVVPPSAPQSPQEPPSSQGERRTSLPAGRKKSSFTTSHKKKRPVMVKRHSSASSSDSRANGSPAIASHFSAMQSSAEHTPLSFAAQSRMRPQSRFQENFSPSSAQSPKKTETPRTNGNKHVSPRKLNGNAKKERPVIGIPASGGIAGLSTAGHKHNSAETNLDTEEIDRQRILLEETNARLERQNQRAIQLIDQVHAEAAAKAIRRPSGGSNHAHDLLSQNAKSRSTVSLAHSLVKSQSTVSLAPTLASPTGQLDLGNLGDSALDAFHPSSSPVSPGKVDKGKGRDPEDLRRTAMFTKRQQQSQPPASPEPSNGLSRSKSQLTFLLEKDRAQTGSKGKEKDTKSPKDKKNRK